jgi:beta-cyano-L-alanine hydratase/nitrilase
VSAPGLSWLFFNFSISPVDVSGSSFGSVLGERTNQGRKQFMQYFKSAIEVPSAATRQIEAVSAKYGIFLVVGVVERDVSTLYCTVIFVHPTKGLLAKRRKLVPTAMERILWGHGDKSTLPLVRTSFQMTDNGTDTDVNVGAVICW